MAALDLPYKKFLEGVRRAHSIVRRFLAFKMIWNGTDTVCRVMDVYSRTNFPDIRKKAVMGTKVGSLLVIPRDRGFLPRYYIKVPKGMTQKRSY